MAIVDAPSCTTPPNQVADGQDALQKTQLVSKKKSGWLVAD
jgi:hypothetical protein